MRIRPSPIQEAQALVVTKPGMKLKLRKELSREPKKESRKKPRVKP